MPKRRRSGTRFVTSSPSTRMRPESGVSKPATSRRMVVLPLPDGPRSARISPRAADSETPRVTGASPKRFSRFSSVRKPGIGPALSTTPRSVGAADSDFAAPSAGAGGEHEEDEDDVGGQVSLVED